MPTTTRQHVVSVGDFFRESWGYDQTNVDFYEVVKVSPSGKSAWLRHVQSSIVEDHGSSVQVAPLAGAYDRLDATNGREGSGTFRRTLKPGWQGGWFVNMTSYSNAYLWDCKAAYETAPGWGH